jgi:pimeloyl-ACP methyl ester carboxylesterase
MTLPQDGASAPLIHSIGRIAEPPTYYEVFSPAAGSDKPPVMMIHGGAHSGACYLATPDGRPGWAHRFIAAGYSVTVPDWPGRGRSGHIAPEAMTGMTIVTGLGAVLARIGRPAIVMTHSMSGAYGWKLVELYGRHIDKLVAVAPGPPGNIQPPAEILAETPDAITVRSPSGAAVSLAREGMSPVERSFVEQKLVGASTLFPREVIEHYAESLNPIPPRLLMERRNVRGSQLRVDDAAAFRGKPILVVTGTDDSEHPRHIDEPIVDWLNANCARAEYIYLGDRGMIGNGHMLMLERNSDEIARLILDWLEAN